MQVDRDIEEDTGCRDLFGVPRVDVPLPEQDATYLREVYTRLYAVYNNLRSLSKPFFTVDIGETCNMALPIDGHQENKGEMRSNLLRAFHVIYHVHFNMLEAIKTEAELPVELAPLTTCQCIYKSVNCLMLDSVCDEHLRDEDNMPVLSKELWKRMRDRLNKIYTTLRTHGSSDLSEGIDVLEDSIK